MNRLFKFDRPLRGHEEDAPAIADEKYVVICDGVGGGGQNKHTVDGEVRSSAYLGSRLLSKTCKEFFDANYDRICENMANAGEIVAELKSTIKNAFDEYVKKYSLVKLFKGKDMRMLPSTLVAVVYKQNGDTIDALVINAGDSRAYYLTPSGGLQQISKDDVDGDVDAYEKSTKINNCVSQDREFYFNYGYYQLKAPCVIFASSDGCFDYIETTMAFEFDMEALLCGHKDKLKDDPTAFGEAVGDVIVKLTGLQDDCSMAACVFGLSDEFLIRLSERASAIKKEYVDPSNQLSVAIKSATSKNTAEIQALQPGIRKAEDALDAVIFERITKELGKLLKADAATGEPLSGLGAVLSELDEWKAFKADVDKRRTGAAEEHKKLREEYEALHKNLIEKYYALRREEHEANVTEVTVINGTAYFSNLDGEMKKEDQFNRLREEYVRSVSLLNSEMIRPTSSGVYSVLDRDFFEHINELFARATGALSAWTETSRQLVEDVMDRSKPLTDDQLKDEFNMNWGSFFNGLRHNTRFTELCSMHDTCRDMQKQLNEYREFDQSDAEKMLDEFISKNKDKLINTVKASAEAAKLGDLPEYTEYKKLSERYDQLYSEITPNVEKKLAIWTKYKAGYELFNNAINRGVVNG